MLFPLFVVNIPIWSYFEQTGFKSNDLLNLVVLAVYFVCDLLGRILASMKFFMKLKAKFIELVCYSRLIFVGLLSLMNFPVGDSIKPIICNDIVFFLTLIIF